MTERDNVPNPRVEFIPQPPVKRVEYWGPEKFINHELDQLFVDAENDPLRPKDAHIGWWALKKELANGTWDFGKVLLELPIRYEGNLEPIDHLKELFVELKPDSGLLYYLIGSFETRDTILRWQFRDHNPEPELQSSVSDYYFKVFYFLFKSFTEAQQSED